MPEIAVIAANIQGDTGGQGISRIHVKHKDGSAIDAAACNSAAAAMRAMWFATATDMPSTTSWIWQSQVNVLDEASGGLLRYMTVAPLPLAVTGQDASKYAAGTGVRIDWLTSTISGRRMMRAANFFVPLTSAAFTTQGQVSTAIQTAVLSAAATFLTALDTANLGLVAYGRPKKGTQSGGHAGFVTSYRVPVTAASLRSRRT